MSPDTGACPQSAHRDGGSPCPLLGLPSQASAGVATPRPPGLRAGVASACLGTLLSDSLRPLPTNEGTGSSGCSGGQQGGSVPSGARPSVSRQNSLSPGASTRAVQLLVPAEAGLSGAGKGSESDAGAVAVRALRAAPESWGQPGAHGSVVTVSVLSGWRLCHVLPDHSSHLWLPWFPAAAFVLGWKQSGCG